jgi:ribosomal protein S18 acetylase RimI-like enzyme
MTSPANPDPAIRRATPRDLAALGRLGASLVRAHHEFDAKRFLSESQATAPRYGSFLGSQLDDPDVAIFVATDAGAVVGYVYAAVEGYDYMSLRGPAGVLHDLVVDPEHRHRGVGRSLVNAALHFFKSRGTPRAVLSTAARNETAQRLFASVGFRPTMIEMTVELED